MDTPPLTTAPPPTAEHHVSFWLAVLAVVAVAIFLIALLVHDRPNSTPVKESAVPVSKQGTYDDRINHPNTTFNITVDEGRLVKGPSTIKVKQGDSVRVNLYAVSEEAHVQLDGYGIITESDPTDDTPGGFSFIADNTGSFKFYSLSEPNPDGVTPPQKTPLGQIIVQ